MKQLTIKDIMTTGAFAALYFICVGLGTLIGLFLTVRETCYTPRPLQLYWEGQFISS